MPNEVVVVLVALLAALVAQIPTFSGMLVLWNRSLVNARDIKNASQKNVVEKEAVDVNKDKYILDQLTSMTNQLNSVTSSLFDVTSKLHESAVQNGAKDVKIEQLKAALELQNTETVTLLKAQGERLRPIEAGMILANQQLTNVQEHQSLASSDTQEQTDAKRNANERNDYNSTQGIVHVVVPGEAPAVQEVPPLDPPPMPVLVVNASTGDVEKRMVS